MGNAKKLVLFFSLLTFVCCTNKQPDKLMDSMLDGLLDRKAYFRLDAYLERNGHMLPEHRLLYYKAFLARTFGDWSESNKYISILQKKHKHELNDTLLKKLLSINAENHVFNYAYKHASTTYQQLIDTYSHVLDSVEVADYRNMASLFGAFSEVKPQLKHKHDLVSIASYRNKFNHFMIPVKSNGVSQDFIFDTGANLSTIAESQAKRMGFKLFDQDVDVGTSTQIIVESKLAVADSLYIGDILFENVIFLVLPDDQLTFPEVDYQIYGIIGFPVINQLEEIHLLKDGSITIPGNLNKRSFRNMFFDGLNPIVQAVCEWDTLLFTFDTGASNSELSFKYFNEHKSEVESTGDLHETERAGAGGQTTVKEYVLSNFPIRIGTKEVTLPKIPVVLEEYDFNKYFDGNLGQDVFTQFDKLIISFKYLFVDFE